MAGTELNEDAWIEEQRKTVEEYLRRERCDHLGVGEYPAFHIYPYLALFAVQSRKAPGWVGWWAICGDLPTDYISSDKSRNPRAAVRAFSQLWLEVSACMLRGEKHPDCSIGPPDRQQELGELLKTGAEILQEYVSWDEMWDEEGGFVPGPDE
jgi:hypothetical protein